MSPSHTSQAYTLPQPLPLGRTDQHIHTSLVFISKIKQTHTHILFHTLSSVLGASSEDHPEFKLLQVRYVYDCRPFWGRFSGWKQKLRSSITSRS
ncbi:hypothetical protein L1987_32658 [Smallanthus sonchifolius]|uniref:Uncharacterized protein n=1 Tax=Smallanthus sonchifolius TaxID=185202 RepID=A0ACB9HQ22_9ASTR|nr:hypothetical protein L1987_32658 [Smallanthus sonchifolius]